MKTTSYATSLYVNMKGAEQRRLAHSSAVQEVVGQNSKVGGIE